MQRWYRRFQSEVLTGISVLIALLIWVVSTKSAQDSLASKWPYFILAGIFCGLALRVVALARSRRFLQERSLSQVPEERSTIRYKYALESARSCYMFLGMSAEEFQREVAIHDYFNRRQAASLPLLNFRIILLHPDSQFFASKLHDVNPGADLQQLVQRKKDIMR